MTLAAACISKVRSPTDARAGWRSLAPRPLREARTLAWLPAVAEGALAVGLLLPGWVGRVAPLGACVLLVGFAVALARALRRADPGECGCFGAFSREPITSLSLARTTSLAAVAALAARAGWPHPGLVPAVADASRRDVVTGLVGAALGLLCLLLSVLWGRDRARPVAGLDRPASVGDPIPRVEVVSRDGQPVLVADLRRGAGLLLVLAKTGCAPCQEVLAEVPAWQQALGAGAHIRLVTSSPRGEFEAEHPELAGVTYYGSLSSRDAFGMIGSPAAILLGADGTLATPVALGGDQIRGLVAGTLAAVQAHSSPST